MKRLKLFLASLVTVLGAGLVVAPVMAPVSAATSGNSINCGTDVNNLDLTKTDCPVDANAADTVNTTVKTVIRVFQVVVGLISVFMIIYGGFKYVISGGGSDSVKNAKNTILYAILGLVIVLIAEGIVQFVLKRFDV
jgi:cytochrome bd-type quinol oxidase subunit 2